MATHSSVLAWKIPWMEELGGLQSMDIHFFSKNWYIVCNGKNTLSVMSGIMAGKAHNGFVDMRDNSGM